MPRGVRGSVSWVQTQLSGANKNKVASVKEKPRCHDSLSENPAMLLGDSRLGFRDRAFPPPLPLGIQTLGRWERQPRLVPADRLIRWRLALLVCWGENLVCTHGTCEAQEPAQGAPIRREKTRVLLADVPVRGRKEPDHLPELP